MKKVVVALMVVLVFTACKNDTKTTEDTNSETENTTVLENGKTAKQNDGLKLFSGLFVYYADAAVLQTNGSIYGIVINEKMHELDEMAQPLKTEPTDYVSVQIRGKLIPKPKDEEGWPFRIEIMEIESVKKYESKDNEVIKLSSNTTE